MNRDLLYLAFLFTSLITACGPQHFKATNTVEGTNELNLETPDDNEELQPPNTPDETMENPNEIVKVTEWIEFPWDEKHKDSIDWNEYAYNSITANGRMLSSIRPTDINSFCPNYDNLNKENKKMFWIGLLSAMAKFESGWKPEVRFTEGFNDSSGNRVVSRGLLQLSYESAKGYDCPISSGQQLHDPEINLLCSVLIIDRWVGRDKVISKKNGGWRGGARYWSVLRNSSKLNSIKSMTKALEICQ